MRFMAWLKTRAWMLVYVFTRGSIVLWLEKEHHSYEDLDVHYVGYFWPDKDSELTLFGKVVGCLFLWTLASLYNTFLVVFFELIVRALLYVLGGAVALLWTIISILFRKTDWEKYQENLDAMGRARDERRCAVA